MKKIIIWALVLLASHATFFIVGDTRGKHIAMKFYIEEIKKADSQVALGRYRIYRDIVSNIKTGRIDRAICGAELQASGYLDDIKSCLADKECRGTIDKATRKVAPEAFGEVPLKFHYWSKSPNGIRQCEEKKP